LIWLTHTEERGNHKSEDAPYAVVVGQETRPRQHADAGHEGQLEEELHHARNEHGPGQRECGLVEKLHPVDGARDQREVEKHRRERRHGKTRIAVQHRTREAGERNEEEVRESDADHLGGERHLLRHPEESRREHQRDHGGTHHGDRRDRKQRRTEDAAHGIHQLLHLGHAARGLVLRKHRHEGLRERTLGE
jgi:hypothetical protein